MFHSKAFTGFISLAIALSALAQDVSQPGLIWDDLETSTELKWTECYTQPLQCARFQVPLNYSDPEGTTASIAVIRFPSPLAGTEEYKGPILLNPGGPGASGVEMVEGSGEMFSQLLGPNFDIVSFDPRGIGFSTPRGSVFPTEAQRQLYLERDMLRIVEAHGEEKIRYWGFSYGTVLGATFAALFPDRIERLVLDGVVDAENYFATLYSNNLLDTDKALQSFFDSCFEGGPDLCPFYESSPQAIARKLDELTQSIFLRPVPVVTSLSYGLVDYSRLRNTIFLSLYSPYTDFPRLAQGLADLARGNGTTLYQFLETPAFDCACGTQAPLQPVLDGRNVIGCTDGKEVSDTFEESESYLRDLLLQSQWAELWATLRISCLGWPKQEKKHFQGPFVGNTSHPILWIGNTADPVTPVASAHKMAKGFPGSIVLTQDSPGHSSMSAPSTCTAGHVREYFLNGTLPAEGVVCPVDGPIFSAQKASTLEARQVEGEDQILQVLERLRQTFRVASPF
ncbi:Serine protease/Carboxylesterase S33 [Pleurotus pulmonarius]